MLLYMRELTMKYNLDLECLSIQEYKSLLKKQNLLPGRRLLKQDIDKNFDIFERQGLNNIAQLKKSLSTPAKISAFSVNNSISEEYLVLLKREIGSLEQKPVLLSNFPGINPSLIAELNQAGFKTSKDYFEFYQTQTDELLCLCDLVRINGVGTVAAKAFYEAGYKSVLDVARADAAIMLEKVTVVNEKQQYYKAKLGQKDMQFCIDFALLLERYCTRQIKI